MKIPGGIVFQMLKSSKLIFLFSLFFIEKGSAESVQFVFVEEKKPKILFLFPGRASLLTLPCQMTKALIGSPNDIKAEVDKASKKDIHILLKKWRSKPSNLILKCRDKVFLFSLIPAKNTHYDYVKVLGHISAKPLKVKPVLPNASSDFFEKLKKKDFTIKKVLDFSWEDEK